MTIFTQWDKLLTLLAKVAKGAARSETQYEFNRLDLSTGKATMKDRAMNAVALVGGEVTVAVPDTDPGKARDFLLRAECTAATDLTFAGADFEGSEGGELKAPDEGETVIYFFTETKAGTFLVGRKVVEKLDNEEE